MLLVHLLWFLRFVQNVWDKFCFFFLKCMLCHPVMSISCFPVQIESECSCMSESNHWTKRVQLLDAGLISLSTAFRPQEQQKRFSPCCLLGPPPPPLFPPPTLLWRRHTPVSHVTFYCGISSCWYVLELYPYGLWLSVPWVRLSVNSLMAEHALLAGRNGLTSPLLRVLIIKVHTGISLKCKCCKEQTGVCIPLLFH